MSIFFMMEFMTNWEAFHDYSFYSPLNCNFMPLCIARLLCYQYGNTRLALCMRNLPAPSLIIIPIGVELFCKILDAFI